VNIRSADPLKLIIAALIPHALPYRQPRSLSPERSIAPGCVAGRLNGTRETTIEHRMSRVLLYWLAADGIVDRIGEVGERKCRRCSSGPRCVDPSRGEMTRVGAWVRWSFLVLAAST
jgi:hypothetical protein